MCAAPTFFKIPDDAIATGKVLTSEMGKAFRDNHLAIFGCTNNYPTATWEMWKLYWEHTESKGDGISGRWTSDLWMPTIDIKDNNANSALNAEFVAGTAEITAVIARLYIESGTGDSLTKRWTGWKHLPFEWEIGSKGDNRKIEVRTLRVSSSSSTSVITPQRLMVGLYNNIHTPSEPSAWKVTVRVCYVRR